MTRTPIFAAAALALAGLTACQPTDVLRGTTAVLAPADDGDGGGTPTATTVPPTEQDGEPCDIDGRPCLPDTSVPAPDTCDGRPGACAPTSTTDPAPDCPDGRTDC